MEMQKVAVKNPIVELQGDEMARVMWDWIRDTLILPYVEIELVSFDYDIRNRDRTDNRILVDAADAIKKFRVGAKCAAINPDQARVEEFGLKKAWKSPNSGTRNQIGGTLFRAPIVFSNVPRLVPGWTEPIVVARHAFGDLYGGTDITIPGKGKVYLRFVAESGEATEVEVYDFKGPGAALGVINTDESVTGFARSCMNYALERGYPVYLGTKNTELEHYDGLFKRTFESIYETEFKDRFEAAGIFFQHRMVDDLAAHAIRSSGGFVWACKNYDGDIQSDMVAAGFGSLGLMSSVLLTPDGRIALTEAAHGTVTRHFREHQAGRETSTNPIASIYAWTRALQYRGAFDDTPAVRDFGRTIEEACTAVVEGGRMTKDLAILCGIEDWLTTRRFLDAVRVELEARL